MDLNGIGRWLFIAILVAAALVFTVLAFALYHNGAFDILTAVLLVLAGVLFGFMVATKVVKPNNFSNFSESQRSLLLAFGWIMAIAGFILFAAIWLHFLLFTKNISARAAWKTSGVALLALMAITPNALAIHDWLSQVPAPVLEEVRLQKPEDDETEDGEGPNHA